MKKEPASSIKITAEDLLEGLIAQCHTIIRDEIIPWAHELKPGDRIHHLHSINDVMASAVKLADALGRLRTPAPPPEIRQRITVERIEPAAVPRLSPPQGEGGGPER